MAPRKSKNVSQQKHKKKKKNKKQKSKDKKSKCIQQPATVVQNSQNVSAKIQDLINEAMQDISREKIVQLLMEVRNKAENCYDFDVSWWLQKYLEQSGEVNLIETAYAIVNAGHIYGRKVDYFYELIRRMVHDDKEQAEANEKKAQAPKSRRKITRQAISLHDRLYESDMAIKPFKQANDARITEVMATSNFKAPINYFKKWSEYKAWRLNHKKKMKSPVPYSTMCDDLYLHTAMWGLSSIEDFEYDDDFDTKRNYRLFTHHMEHRYNTLVPDLNFILHFKVKDYVEAEEDDIVIKRLLHLPPPPARHWPPFCSTNINVGESAEDYGKKYIDLEDMVLEKDYEIDHNLLRSATEAQKKHSNQSLPSELVVATNEQICDTAVVDNDDDITSDETTIPCAPAANSTVIGLEEQTLAVETSNVATVESSLLNTAEAEQSSATGEMLESSAQAPDISCKKDNVDAMETIDKSDTTMESTFESQSTSINIAEAGKSLSMDEILESSAPATSSSSCETENLDKSDTTMESTFESQSTSINIAEVEKSLSMDEILESSAPATTSSSCEKENFDKSDTAMDSQLTTEETQKSEAEKSLSMDEILESSAPATTISSCEKENLDKSDTALEESQSTTEETHVTNLEVSVICTTENTDECGTAVDSMLASQSTTTGDTHVPTLTESVIHQDPHSVEASCSNVDKSQGESCDHSPSRVFIESIEILPALPTHEISLKDVMNCDNHIETIEISPAEGDNGKQSQTILSLDSKDDIYDESTPSGPQVGQKNASAIIAESIKSNIDGQIVIRISIDEGIAFSDLDDVDKVMLSPVVELFDIFEPIDEQNRRNILKIDDRLLDTQETFDLPLEMICLKPEIEYNILQLPEWRLKRKVNFALTEEFELYMKDRMKRRCVDNKVVGPSRVFKCLQLNEVNDQNISQQPPASPISDDDFLGFDEPEVDNITFSDALSSTINAPGSTKTTPNRTISRDSGIGIHPSAVIDGPDDVLSIEQTADGLVIEYTTPSDPTVPDESTKSTSENAMTDSGVDVADIANTEEISSVQQTTDSGENQSQNPSATTVDESSNVGESDELTDADIMVVEVLPDEEENITSQDITVEKFLETSNMNGLANSEMNENQTQSSSNKDANETIGEERVISPSPSGKLKRKNELQLKRQAYQQNPELEQTLYSKCNSRSSLLSQEDLNIIMGKVIKWHRYLAPILAVSMERHHFDIYKIGTNIMDTFPVSDNMKPDEPAVISLDNVMEGHDPTFLSRYFLSMLQLANANNVEITIHNRRTDSPTPLTDVRMKLRSRKRHAISTEDDIGAACKSYSDSEDVDSDSDSERETSPEDEHVLPGTSQRRVPSTSSHGTPPSKLMALDVATPGAAATSTPLVTGRNISETFPFSPITDALSVYQNELPPPSTVLHVSPCNSSGSNIFLASTLTSPTFSTPSSLIRTQESVSSAKRPRLGQDDLDSGIFSEISSHATVSFS